MKIKHILEGKEIISDIISINEIGSCEIKYDEFRNTNVRREDIMAFYDDDMTFLGSCEGSGFKMKEFKNKQMVEVFTGGEWEQAVYIGFDKSTNRHVVSIVLLEYTGFTSSNIRNISTISDTIDSKDREIFNLKELCKAHVKELKEKDEKIKDLEYKSECYGKYIKDLNKRESKGIEGNNKMNKVTIGLKSGNDIQLPSSKNGVEEVREMMDENKTGEVILNYGSSTIIFSEGCIEFCGVDPVEKKGNVDSMTEIVNSVCGKKSKGKKATYRFG